MLIIKERYIILYNDKQIGTYYLYDNGEYSLDSYDLPEEYTKNTLMRMIPKMMVDTNRVSGTRKHIWQSGPIKLERIPKDVEKFWVYRRDSKKGETTYSPKSYSKPHYIGHYVDGMEEWVSWYCFNKKDDGMYEAELDEAWNEGSHNGGGTIDVEVPEEWLDLEYDEFLERVVTLSAASRYGFTVEDLKEKEGLKEFFGF